MASGMVGFVDDQQVPRLGFENLGSALAALGNLLLLGRETATTAAAESARASSGAPSIGQNAASVS